MISGKKRRAQDNGNQVFPRYNISRSKGNKTIPLPKDILGGFSVYSNWLVSDIPETNDPELRIWLKVLFEYMSQKLRCGELPKMEDITGATEISPMGTQIDSYLEYRVTMDPSYGTQRRRATQKAIFDFEKELKDTKMKISASQIQKNSVGLEIKTKIKFDFEEMFESIGKNTIFENQIKTLFQSDKRNEFLCNLQIILLNKFKLRSAKKYIVDHNVFNPNYRELVQNCLVLLKKYTACCSNSEIIKMKLTGNIQYPRTSRYLSKVLSWSICTDTDFSNIDIPGKEQFLGPSSEVYEADRKIQIPAMYIYTEGYSISLEEFVSKNDSNMNLPFFIKMVSQVIDALLCLRSQSINWEKLLLRDIKIVNDLREIDGVEKTEFRVDVFRNIYAEKDNPRKLNDRKNNSYFYAIEEVVVLFTNLFFGNMYFFDQQNNVMENKTNPEAQKHIFSILLIYMQKQKSMYDELKTKPRVRYVEELDKYRLELTEFANNMIEKYSALHSISIFKNDDRYRYIIPNDETEMSEAASKLTSKSMVREEIRDELIKKTLQDLKSSATEEKKILDFLEQSNLELVAPSTPRNDITETKDTTESTDTKSLSGSEYSNIVFEKPAPVSVFETEPSKRSTAETDLYLSGPRVTSQPVQKSRTVMENLYSIEKNSFQTNPQTLLQQLKESSGKKNTDNVVQTTLKMMPSDVSRSTGTKYDNVQQILNLSQSMNFDENLELSSQMINMSRSKKGMSLLSDFDIRQNILNMVPMTLNLSNTSKPNIRQSLVQDGLKKSVDLEQEQLTNVTSAIIQQMFQQKSTSIQDTSALFNRVLEMSVPEISYRENSIALDVSSKNQSKTMMTSQTSMLHNTKPFFDKEMSFPVSVFSSPKTGSMFNAPSPRLSSQITREKKRSPSKRVRKPKNYGSDVIFDLTSSELGL